MDVNQVRTDIANAIRDCVPNSCFMQLVDKKRFPAPKKQTCPIPPVEIGKSAGIDTAQRLFMAMSISEEEIEVINQTTIDQSYSDEWIAQRKGRITASKIHDVHTRLKSIRKDPTQSPEKLVRRIMGYGSNPMTPAMKHGLAMEPHAKRKFKQMFSKVHKKVSFQESGLVVCKEAPYLAASPDLMVTCDCHGKAICEIKCPYTIRDAIPSSSNVQYLRDNSNGESKLSDSHKYYSQIQAQMGILKLKICYFFVFTCHGYHMELIPLDDQKWTELFDDSRDMWMRYVAPEILSNSMVHLEDAAEASMLEEIVVNKNQTESAAMCRGPLTTHDIPVVYLCGECQHDCTGDPNRWHEESIECTDCHLWFHLKCVGFTENDDLVEEDVWLCSDCK